jgi:hypothetical protein
MSRFSLWLSAARETVARKKMVVADFLGDVKREIFTRDTAIVTGASLLAAIPALLDGYDLPSVFAVGAVLLTGYLLFRTAVLRAYPRLSPSLNR